MQPVLRPDFLPDSILESRIALNATRVRPPWPGQPYHLACPEDTLVAECNLLSSAQSAIDTGCSEPELDTVEVLNSFLPGRTHAPLYIDIGCNLGYHAAHAAALGAFVECYEPTPMYVRAILESRRLNEAAERWTVHNAAVTPQAGGGGSSAKHGGKLRFRRAYQPCDIGGSIIRKTRFWDTPTVPLLNIISGRHIALLKIDIDSVEGRLLHTVERALARGNTTVETILVELGDDNWPDAWCNSSQATVCPTPPRENALRGGNVLDVWKLQHQHGYDVYRINIHTGREIYNWRGVNVNTRMAEVPAGLEPMFFVRNMRKLERLREDTPLSQFAALFRWGQSYLFTRVRLAQVTKHHWFDLLNMEYGTIGAHRRGAMLNKTEHARLQRDRLNAGIPSARPG